MLDAAETLFARLGDSAGLARVLLLGGWTAFLTGDVEVAVGFLEEALARIEAARVRHLLPRALRMLSVVDDRRDNDEKAAALQERALAAARDLGDEVGVSLILADMAWTALRRGQYERARRLAEKSLDLFGGSTTTTAEAAIQHTIGLALFGLGKRAEALELAQGALRLAWDGHDVVCTSALLDLLGAVAADLGAEARAARLTGAAEGLLEGIGASAAELEAARQVYAPVLDRACERGGRTAWEAERTFGTTIGFDEAVEYALESDA